MRLEREERVKIEQLRRQTRDKKQHVRLSVLIMLDEGYTHEVIAVSQRIDSDTVGNFKQKYLQQGLEGYESHPILKHSLGVFLPNGLVKIL